MEVRRFPPAGQRERGPAEPHGLSFFGHGGGALPLPAVASQAVFRGGGPGPGGGHPPAGRGPGEAPPRLSFRRAAGRGKDHVGPHPRPGRQLPFPRGRRALQPLRQLSPDPLRTIPGCGGNRRCFPPRDRSGAAASGGGGLPPRGKPLQGLHHRRGPYAHPGGLQCPPQNLGGAAAPRDLHVRHHRAPQSPAHGPFPLPGLLASAHPRGAHRQEGGGDRAGRGFCSWGRGGGFFGPPRRGVAPRCPRPFGAARPGRPHHPGADRKLPGSSPSGPDRFLPRRPFGKGRGYSSRDRGRPFPPRPGSCPVRGGGPGPGPGPSGEWGSGSSALPFGSRGAAGPAPPGLLPKAPSGAFCFGEMRATQTSPRGGLRARGSPGFRRAGISGFNGACSGAVLSARG